MKRALVAAVLVVGANLGAYRWNGQIDLSASHRFTLSSDTRSLAKAVKSHLAITAFLSDLGGSAKDARFLLARYHELNRRITYRVIDPDANPGEAKRFGVTRYSTVVLTYEGRRADAADAEELEISTAMLKLLRGSTPVVCVLTGHGEPALDDTSTTGMSTFQTLLTQNAYQPRALDLRTGPVTVPDDCAVVVVAGPVDPLLPTETDALVRWARAGHDLLVLASPLTRGDPNPLLNPWGVEYAGGLVLDPLRDQGVDQSNIIVEDFPSVSPVLTGVSSLQFPAGGGLVTQAGTDGGRTIEELGLSSSQGFVESEPDTHTSFHAGDIPGPVALAASVDDSRVVPGPDPHLPGSTTHVQRTRLVVTGGDAWATNSFIDDLSNRRFMVNALAWLTQSADLVTATSHPNGSRPFPMTPEHRTSILLITVVLVPAVILVLGGGVGWAIRRRR